MSRVYTLSRLKQSFRSPVASQAFADILLIAIAILVIVIANSPLAVAYHWLFHGALPWTPIGEFYNAHLWINDALMVMFFFVAVSR